MFIILSGICWSCNERKQHVDATFEVLDSKRTGLDFSNDLKYDQRFNLFKYIYFYNGSGVGAGDFNNDGLVDLFFGSNQGNNRLYLNTGNLHFKDITTPAQVPEDGGWTTGVSVVDINNDGLLDIYVCRVGQYEILKGKNQLLINQGVDKQGNPRFVDEAKAYGLDFSGFSTQAAFFDYDLDGDLDMFLLNHSVHENGTFRPRKDFLGTYHPLSGDRFYRNDAGHFVDVTRETGINSTAIGYGLGIAISDINLDGYPDIYIGNDFHENDYLYINQHDGSFREEGEQRMMHSSQFSMGVDVADANNDANPEIISMDMLPEDPYILKRSLGEDAYDIFHYKVSVGYSHQYTRNNLQYNRRDSLFSEVGLYSGIAATDWSWAPLWMDFDNDGWKDLFISNGIPKRMNDIDYINFVSNAEIRQNIQDNNMKEKDITLINKFPEIKLPNKFYRNTGNLSFEDEGASVSGAENTFSNGAVYADLDNDGDLDIVVNNIDAPALVYENKHAKAGAISSLQLDLHGPSNNTQAVGARVLLYTGTEVRTYEKYAAKGFLSSMEVPLLIGLEKTKVDSILLVWPDGSYESVNGAGTRASLKMNYRTGLPRFDFRRLTGLYPNETEPMTDMTRSTGIDYLHTENHFVEFDREPLLPHMVSTEGPAVAVADINHDGLEDVYLGSARNGKSALFLQRPGGQFIKKSSSALDLDSAFENTDAIWVDANGDGHLDLVVASGGNDFYGQDEHNTPRLYLNDGQGNLSRLANAFGNLSLTASCVTAHDFNKDGFPDLFIGGRVVPWEYGQTPRSYLLQNDGTGKFREVTAALAPGLDTVGFVTQAVWYDLDKDGDSDLLLSLEWGNITAFMNVQGRFEKKVLGDKKGWWNFVYPCDIDQDGDIDLVAGNLGLNSRLKASATEPVRLYYNDFDDNGKHEQVMTYYLKGKELPFANKAELEKQIPLLKKKFLYAEDFAKASLTELLGADKLSTAKLLTADYFSNAIMINDGELHFETRAMPWQAQLSPFRDATMVYANKDSLPDLLLMGNYYDNNIQMGRYDADFGSLLINKGGGNFGYSNINGLNVKGQVRHIRTITINKQQAYILARNDDHTMLIRFAQSADRR